MIGRRQALPQTVPFLLLALCFLARIGHAELLISEQSPAKDAIGIGPDAPLRLKFTEAPLLGNKGRVLVYHVVDGKLADSIDLSAPGFTNIVGGRLQHYHPIVIEGNEAVIWPHAHKLAYEESYRVEIEPGVFKDSAGNDFNGLAEVAQWNFSTKSAPPKGAASYVVAADGKGDFCTVQSAVDYIPDDNMTPVRINIRNGMYNGMVYLGQGKDHIHLIGQDRKKVILWGVNNDRYNPGRLGRSLINVEANDFTAENLTIHNTTPYRGSQAEALRVNGDRCILRDCDFYSFQDTLLLSGRVYVTNCYVEGDVDFIWGQGVTFFENCEIKAVHNGYYLQSRSPGNHLGYVFLNCKLTAAPGVDKCWLARIDSNRFPRSQAAFVNCQMGPQVPPAGWQVSGTNQTDVGFLEFRTTDLDGKPLDVSKRHPSSRQMSDTEAADMSDTAKVFSLKNAWDPRVTSSTVESDDPPSAVTTAPNATFTVVASGSAPLVYHWNFNTGNAAKIFDVRAAGAKGDGKTLDTAAIQKAIDDCGKAGGGIVQFTAGTYLSKPIVMRSHTTLQLAEGATLKATDEESDFADPARPGAWRVFVPFIGGKGLTNVTITGPGTIDGSGQHWWGPARDAKLRDKENPGYTLPRPKLIILTRCSNVQVTNITLMKSPCFHLVPTECENVLIDSVTILAPADSPNTDAIDPTACRHVVITRCKLDVGDDNVAIKGSQSSYMSQPVCDDITVSNCTMLHGHGMSIGSESAGGVRNVTVRDCTFQFTDNGLRIKSPRGRGGIVENISYSDITMKDVDPAITFTCYYPNIPDRDEPRPITNGTPVFRNIRISNVTATCPKSAGIIVGLPESLVSNVVLENVKISAATGLSIRNAKGIQLKNVQVTAQRGESFLVQDAQVEGLPAREK